MVCDRTSSSYHKPKTIIQLVYVESLMKYTKRRLSDPSARGWSGPAAAQKFERPFCPHLGETGPLSQGVQVRRKALRTRHINGMKVRKKRPRGFEKRPRGFK